jgi:hypothetical protein
MVQITRARMADQFHPKLEIGNRRTESQLQCNFTFINGIKEQSYLKIRKM